MTEDLVMVPVVECSRCLRPYVLRLALESSRQAWCYVYQRDCKCRQGMAAATNRSAFLDVLDRLAAAQAALNVHADELAPRRSRKEHQ